MIPIGGSPSGWNRWEGYLQDRSLSTSFMGAICLQAILASRCPMLVNFSRLILSWVRVYNEFELQCEFDASIFNSSFKF